MERKRERGKEREEKMGGEEVLGGSQKFTALKVPRQCPLVLILK
jgi:hypothetical protein